MPDMQCTMLINKPTRRSTRILTPSSEVYRLANQFRRENADVVGNKPVKNNAGEMSISEHSKQKAWLEHYQRLLNVVWLGPRPPVLSTTSGRPTHPNHHWYGEEGYLTDEGWQSTGSIRHSGRDDTSSWWHGRLHDPWPCSCNHSRWQGTLWLGAEFVSLYKGKGTHWKEASTVVLSWQSRSWKSWRGLWMTSRIVDGLNRQMVSIDDSQFGFVPGSGTTDAIFVVRQLQEKYLAANKRLYMASVDLERAFDWVPLKVIWWALRKLGVEEWIVPLVQGMYANARSRVHVGEGYSEEFEVKVSVHQGSVLHPLLFIIVLEFRSGVPWEDLYDLVIIAESLEEWVRRLLTWKEAMKKKGLRVNAGKTKIMICDMDLDLL